MSLSEYEKKRHFNKTPEPEPKVKKQDKKRFVIHRHDASHLHYDLRLEHGGVLKSWAMPKGLPRFKGDKKLSVLVEDHPVKYLDFKGTIPKGEYGAGTVEIFDRGTYEPIGDFDKDFKKGHIRFFLKGEKISGSFTLVNFRDKNWLFFIHEIEDFLPELKNIGEESPMLKNVEAMKAVLIDEPFDSDEWLFEVKWDGIRAISYIKDDRLSILSRKQNEQNFRYPELQHLPEYILAKEAVIDGEIVSLDERGISSFELLQQRMGLQNKREIDSWSKKMPVFYYLFDILYLNGRDLRVLPLMERKEILKKIVMPPRNLRFSDFIDKTGVSFYKVAKEKGLEGIIAKKKNSQYLLKRSPCWQKIKIVQEQEAVIGGYTEPQGSRAYFGSLLLGIYDKGELIYIGSAGSGFSDETLKKVFDLMKPLEVTETPFTGEMKTKQKIYWIKPELVAQVKFSEWTKSGKMRQPVFLGLREDKKPKEVIKEIPMRAA